MESANERVYIVDDEASVGEVLSTLLRANGKHVQLFASGQDFLDFARRDSCACLNLKMPGLGGMEVQKLISAKTSIPVIFLAGRGDIPSTVRAMKGGAVDFLTRPVVDTARTGGPSTFGKRFAEQAGSLRVGDHRIQRPNPSWTHNAKGNT